MALDFKKNAVSDQLIHNELIGYIFGIRLDIFGKRIVAAYSSTHIIMNLYDV